jgi:hypothetical protein
MVKGKQSKNERKLRDVSRDEVEKLAFRRLRQRALDRAKMVGITLVFGGDAIRASDQEGDVGVLQQEAWRRRE